jgi:hypothetical protein
LLRRDQHDLPCVANVAEILLSLRDLLQGIGRRDRQPDLIILDVGREVRKDLFARVV